MENNMFGTGFVYILVLISKHYNCDMLNTSKSIYKEGEFEYGKDFTFFYGIRDHLEGIVVPEQYKGTEVEKKVKELKKFCNGNDYITEKSLREMFKIVEDIVISIDKDLGVSPIKSLYP